MPSKNIDEYNVRIDELKKLLNSTAWSPDDWGVDYIYKYAIKKRIKLLRKRAKSTNAWVVNERKVL